MESIGPRHEQSYQGWGVPITEKEGSKMSGKNTICGSLSASPSQAFFLAGITTPPSENQDSERRANSLKATEIASENTNGSTLHSTGADCMVNFGVECTYDPSTEKQKREA